MHSLLVKVAFLFALGISASPAPAPAPAPAPEPVPAPAALVPRNAAPINSGAEALIEKVEGFRKNFYYIDGHKTIGYGHDCAEKKDCNNIHPPITKEQGQALLNEDLPTYEACVCKLPNAAGLNANQYGALVSFAYNSGCGGVHKYFNSYLAAKNYNGICAALPHTNTKNGELTKRRQQEGAFCKQPTSDMSGCQGKVSSSTSKTATKTHTTKTPTKSPTHTPTKSPTKTHTMKAAMETKILKKDQIDNYIMHALLAD